MGRRKKSGRKALTIENSQAGQIPKSKPEKIVKEMSVETSSQVPVDIFSRLANQLVQPSGSANSEYDESEDCIEIKYRPRFVFVSNLCLVCMEVSSVVCETCRMVSYCSVKHQKQDSPKHKDLCSVLTEICSKDYGLPLAKGLSAEDYRIYRLKLVDIVESALSNIGVSRRLELWEREIVLYPRVCRLCHEFSADLNCCPRCKIEFYCNGHEYGHDRWCREFQVLKRILLLQHRHGNAEPEVFCLPAKTPVSLPDNFDTFVANFYQYSSYYLNMDCHTYSTFSNIATVPLSTLYALQKSCPDWSTMTRITVHVVGAEFQFECVDLNSWEKIFMHLLPSLKKLNLIFVGPELLLPDAPLDLLTKVRICNRCKTAGNSINVKFYPGKLYHEIRGTKNYIKPDVICLFNPGLYRSTAFNGRDTWPPTIEEFCKTRAPVLVTSYTEHEIPRDLERIKLIADVDVIVEPKRNPYASLKPDKNFVSDDAAPLIYKNYCIAIIKGKAWK